MPQTKQSKRPDPTEIKPREFDLEGYGLFPAEKLEEADKLDETEATDELGEASELDDEEINPFKDKWEE